MLKLFLLNLLFIVSLDALVYEDAEDSSTKRWTSVSSKYKGKISNVLDKAKKSHVIKFEGNGTKSIYQLRFPPTLENIQMDNSFLTWEMNYVEDFVILIVLDTIEGQRQLIYTPGEKNSYLQYGLSTAKKGKWKKYSRNLEKDLQIYEKNNKILDIEYFVIKGSGSLDNIQLKRLDNKTVIVKKKKPLKEKAKVLVEDYKADILPIINLKGKNPLMLKVGEEYIEAGANAYNRDGSKIDVKITSNIDILKEAEYTVLYIATNKLGNSSIDKRRVIVGNVSEEEEEKVSENCSELPSFLKNSVEVKEIEMEEDIILPERPGL